tara:strand:+ start:389 stop:1234 length:846 start_codon:yes stop_codon:yes gene_type:complete
MHITAYAGGCYGQFTAWTLDWMQGKYSLDFRPFSAKNNSHNNNLQFFWNVDDAVANPVTNSHVHPVTKLQDNFIVNVEKLLVAYDKVVIIYPKLDDFMWSCNNKLTKIYGEEKYLDMIKTNSDWKVGWQSENTWEFREFLSYYLFDQHCAETGFNDVVDYTNDCVYKLSISDIRDNFIYSFWNLAKYLDLNVCRTPKQLHTLANDWIHNEPYLYKDRLIKEIVYATIHDNSVEMNNLSIFDECEIQRQLRIKGYEIECYGLNEWPTNTKQLRKLLYETKIQ